MFDYLQKFKALPQNLRDSVSSPSAMTVIADLEKKYKIDLAAVVMKVMVKTIPLADLTTTFVSDFFLDEISAKKLTAELKERLFFSVANYLGYITSYASVLPKTVPVTSFSTVERIAKESGVTFPGADLNQRFKTILDIYVKGIRSRIDTRITLNKEIISGGLGLNHQIIDKIFKISDDLNKPREEVIVVKELTGLEKVRALYEQPGASRDIPYDLKTAISKGEVKKTITPFNLPTPVEKTEKQLAEPDEELKIEAPIARELTVIKDQEPVKPIPISVSQPLVTAPIQLKPVISPILTPTPVPVLAPMSKIIKPAESKPGIFSKLFGPVTPVVKVVPPVVPLPKVAISTPIQPPVSVAAKRMEAAAGVPAPSRPTAPLAPRQIPHVMSPIDELRFLELVNFRRLGSSPSEATAKVASKIKLLEKDGYDKMISGIIAWKQSPINKLYLKMGQDALRSGQSLKDFAMKAQDLKTPGLLSWEEIELIIKLNNKFMF